MDKDRLSANSSSSLGEFNRRSVSSIFSSLRPKKEKKSKKRFSGSKSIFSTLLLANYEEQFFMSTGGTINESLSYESQKEKLREKINKKIMKEKALKEVETKSQISSDNNSDSATDESINRDDDENVNCSVVVTLDIDESCIHSIYQDVLFIILHRLGGFDEDDEDCIKIDSDSALQYVRDAFAVDESKHENFLVKVKELQSEECSVASKSAEGFKAHIKLLKILLKHEIESSKIPQHYWSGKFSFLASTILSLHADFHKLQNASEKSFACWAAFSEIHYQYPLNTKTFKDLLDDIVDVYSENEEIATTPSRKTSIRLPACLSLVSPSLQQKALEAASNRCGDQLKTEDNEIMKSFWHSSQKLSEAFTNFIRKIHYENEEIDTIKILREIFEIEKRIEKILPMNFKIISDPRFVELVKKALTEGTAMHLMKNIKNRNLKSRNSEKRLCELIRVMNFAQNHLKNVAKKYSEIFASFYGFSFSSHLYKVYDIELTHLIKPIVTDICNTREGNIENYNKIEENIATKLFELYLQLKVFSDHGMELYGMNELRMAKYYEWFTANVDKWNMVSVFNTMTRIERAIEMDKLKPELKDQLFSSSAIDTMQILYSVKKFWQNLKWSDEAREAEVKNNVAHDIFRFTMLYYEKLSDKTKNIDAMKNTNAGIFKFPIETCIAIANFNYVSVESETCVADLTKNLENVQKAFENSRTFEAKAIRDLLEFTFKKTSVTIKKLMLEGAEKDNHRSDDIADRLMTYVEDTMNSLHHDLSSKDNDMAKFVFWEEILQVFEEVIQVSIQRQMTPQFFSNLKKIFSVLKEIFKFDENENFNLEKVTKIDRVLDRYGLNTSRLIHQYFKDRYEMQNQIQKTPFNPNGMLTVFCYFTGNILKLEILNARNLIPLGPNKKCDPFVKVSIEPKKHFSNIREAKTKTQQDTHFPLYDETFQFQLSDEQKNIKDAILFFNIKNRCLIIDECIAEAFLSFKDIPEYSSSDKKVQIHLTLTRLQSDEIESLKALKHRAEANDKDAKEFLSKLKSKTLISAKKLRLPITQL